MRDGGEESTILFTYKYNGERLLNLCTADELKVGGITSVAKRAFTLVHRITSEAAQSPQAVRGGFWQQRVHEK